jgi:hypothetical protein
MWLDLLCGLRDAALSAGTDTRLAFERCQLVETAAVTHFAFRGARGAKHAWQRGSRRKTKSRMTTKRKCLSGPALYVDSHVLRLPRSHTETGSV